MVHTHSLKQYKAVPQDGPVVGNIRIVRIITMQIPGALLIWIPI